jgi:hypothetical protein
VDGWTHGGKANADPDHDDRGPLSWRRHLAENRDARIEATAGRRAMMAVAAEGPSNAIARLNATTARQLIKTP